MSCEELGAYVHVRAIGTRREEFVIQPSRHYRNEEHVSPDLLAEMYQELRYQT